MEVTNLFSKSLGRSLRSEEVHLLRCLSASGIAKINADLARGVDLEATLSELQGVFQLVQARRGSALGRLSQTAEGLLGQLNGPCPTEVVVLAAEAPLLELLRRVSHDIVEGEELEDILDELALEHLDRKLQADSQLLADAHTLPVSICRLSPTQAAVQGNVASPTAAQVGRAAVLIGLSPVVMWFECPPSEPSVDLPRQPAASQPRQPLARGILKPSNGGVARTLTASSNGLSEESMETPRVRFSGTVEESEVEDVPLEDEAPQPSAVKGCRVDQQQQLEQRGCVLSRVAIAVPPAVPKVSLLSRVWAKCRLPRGKSFSVGR
eukprot:RCo011823